MAKLIRTSLSLEEALCGRMDDLVRSSGMNNRSEFMRNLLRKELVEKEWEEDREAVVTVTLVYDHQVHDIQHRLTDLQHSYARQIIANLHIHLSRDRCLEVVVARGRGSVLKKLVYAMRGLKGVLHGEATMSSTGSGL